MIAYFIIANGPMLSAARLKTLIKGQKIIALDGAADKLRPLDIRPDILLGDFDSLEEVTYWKKQKGISIIPTEDQNFTDLQKAIDFCDTQQATSIEICSATEGRFDHTISNVRVLKQKYRKGRPLRLYTETQTLIYLKDETYDVTGRTGAVVGLFGFPQGCVTTQGLKFELHHFILKFAETESVANALRGEVARIRVEGEVLVVAPQ